MRLMRCGLWLVFLALVGCTSRGPIHVEAIEMQTAQGPVRGFLAWVDLTDPSVQVVVTSAEALPLDAPHDAEVMLRTTPQWANEQGATLAVNANYFSVLSDRRMSDIIGLCVSDGAVVSQPRQFATTADPVLVFDPHKRARITRGADLSNVYDAVAGIGPSEAEPSIGGLLVTAGINTGATARVQPAVRHPRTAAGVNESGDRLCLVVVDGRQPGWSVGMTLEELADVLIRAGVYNAVNLDGGGSSSFYYMEHPPGEKARYLTLQNRPSDGGFRPVANHLGIRLVPNR